MAQKTTPATNSALNSAIPASTRKRQQIANSNRTMFLWVAGASVIVAFSIVGSIFITKQLVFNQKIIAAKTTTADVLKKNIDSAKELDAAINKLRADRNISSVPSSTTKANNLDKVLDALPYEGDWIGLGSSLQSTLLRGISVESLSVDSISLDAVGSSGVDPSLAASVADAQAISFSFKVSGNVSELKTLMERLNNSIRPIKIVNLKLESGGPGRIDATVQAVTYYQSKKTFELREEAIKP